MRDGPFAEYVPTRKRKPQIICDKDYLLILKGIDIPTPPTPFVTERSSPYASGFSPQSGISLSEFVHKFAGNKHTAFDPRYIAAFDDFINQFSHLFIADYRKKRGTGLVILQPRRNSVETTQIEFAKEPYENGNEFDPATLEDRRRKVLASVVQRPGQSAFRMAIMRAYEGKCCITGCPQPETLEAAHIVSYCGPDSDHVCNGLLLRLDVHALFDAFLLTIDHECRVCLGARLLGGYYGFLEGKAVRLPRDVHLRPSPEALRRHGVAFERRNQTEDLRRRHDNGY